MMKRILFVLSAGLLFCRTACVFPADEYGPLSPSFVSSFLSISQEIVLSIGDLRRGYEAEFGGGDNQSNWILAGGQNRLERLSMMIQKDELPASGATEIELNKKLSAAVSNLLMSAVQISHHQKWGIGKWKEGSRLFLEACDVVLQSKIPHETKAQIEWMLRSESFTLRGEPYTGATMADFSGQYHYILCVVPDSPADEAGIQSGDILHKFGDSHIGKPYKPQTWYIIRNGKEGIVSLTPILFGY